MKSRKSLLIAVAGAFTLCLSSAPAKAGASQSPKMPAAGAAEQRASSERFAPADLTAFAPFLKLVAPGPMRARRALAVLDRQLAFQRKISFHPVYGPNLEKLIGQLPPRQSTLIRAGALYSQSTIPWIYLPDGTHMIAVSGEPRTGDYYYSLARKYLSPEQPGSIAGRFALRPAPASQDGALSNVVGTLGGELLIDTYGASAAVDVLAAILRQNYGDLKPPWDSAPGRFNHHDQAALRRMRREFPALGARIEHYLDIRNIFDEFEAPDGSIVLMNFDAVIRPDALEPFPHLSKFYERVASTLKFSSAIYDRNGHYWIKTGFDRGHIRIVLLEQRGMLVPFDADYHPAGSPVALDLITRGHHRTVASVRVSRLGMTFGLENLEFTADYVRDGARISYENRMSAVPEVVAPPLIHEMIKFIAGDFMRTLAQGNGGLKAAFESRPTSTGLFWFGGGFTGEFKYSPTLEFLARIGDRIAERHNSEVRAEERRLGEDLFTAFLSDYNRARPRILSLDGSAAETGRR